MDTCFFFLLWMFWREEEDAKTQRGNSSADDDGIVVGCGASLRINREACKIFDCKRNGLRHTKSRPEKRNDEIVLFILEA